MLEPIMTPADKKYRELQLQTEKIHRENLRRRIEIRLHKAEESGNRQLLALLQKELEDLR